MISQYESTVNVQGRHTMLFVRTRIFVVLEFSIQCSSERMKFPNSLFVRTNFYSGRRFCKKNKDFGIFVRKKSFRPKIFLFVQIFFCLGEDFFIRLNIISVRTNKILLVRTFFVDPNIFKIC